MIKKLIPKQMKIGTSVGGLKDLLGRTMFYISMINFCLLMVTAYHTTIKNYVEIPFYMFFVMIGIVVLVSMVFEYVIVLPSSVGFSNTQVYKHENPLKDDIKKILKKLNELEEKNK